MSPFVPKNTPQTISAETYSLCSITNIRPSVDPHEPPKTITFLNPRKSRSALISCISFWVVFSWIEANGVLFPGIQVSPIISLNFFHDILSNFWASGCKFGSLSHMYSGHHEDIKQEYLWGYQITRNLEHVRQ